MSRARGNSFRARADMSSSVRSPSKERKDDASPGLQTPNDASPEHSIATPGHDGGRSSGTKRSREDELEGETSTDRATRSRSASTVARLPGLRVRVKSVCGDLSSVITKLRDSGCVVGECFVETLKRQTSGAPGAVDDG